MYPYEQKYMGIVLILIWVDQKVKNTEKWLRF